jgi:SAM-dependent methyltransferase
MAEPITRSRDEWIKRLSTMTHGMTAGYGDCYDFGHEQFRQLVELGGIHDGTKRALDIGCGNGRMAIPFTETDIEYLGIDPIPECITYCGRQFAPWHPQMKFIHRDIRSSRYNPHGKIKPMHFSFMAFRESVDFLMMWSVLSHTQHMQVAKHYLDEVRRVLVDGGQCWLTFFVADKHSQSSFRTRYTLEEVDELFAGWDFKYREINLNKNKQSRFLIQKV